MWLQDEVIDAALRKAGYGGLFHVLDVGDEVARVAYEHYKRVVDRMGESPRGKAPLARAFPGARGVLAARSDVGALCTRINGEPEFYVALCQGTFGVLSVMFERLMAEPDVFPWVGDVSVEEGGRWSKPLPTNLTYMDPSERIVPNDRTRLYAATLMAINAVRFITLHEFWHVMSGYVNFLEMLQGQSGVSEQAHLVQFNALPGMPSPSLLLQHCELEADGFAACQALYCYLGPGGLVLQR